VGVRNWPTTVNRPRYIHDNSMELIENLNTIQKKHQHLPEIGPDLSVANGCYRGAKWVAAAIAKYVGTGTGVFNRTLFHALSSFSRAFASFRSLVSKPSVNHWYTGAKRS
jgi:hypothetical protein